MDDGELLPGKEYFVKIGTKEIPGIVTNIQYKIDVNTGEYIPANNLRKNEIAVCDVILQEEIVLDELMIIKLRRADIDRPYHKHDICMRSDQKFRS